MAYSEEEESDVSENEIEGLESSKGLEFIFFGDSTSEDSDDDDNEAD